MEVALGLLISTSLGTRSGPGESKRFSVSMASSKTASWRCLLHRLSRSVYPRFDYFCKRLESIQPRFDSIIRQQSEFDLEELANIESLVKYLIDPLEVAIFGDDRACLQLSDFVKTTTPLQKQPPNSSLYTGKIADLIDRSKVTLVYIFVVVVPSLGDLDDIQNHLTGLQELNSRLPEMNAFVALVVEDRACKSNFTDRHKQFIKQALVNKIELDKIVFMGKSNPDGCNEERVKTFADAISDSLEKQAIRLVEKIDDICIHCQGKQNETDDGVSSIEKLRFEISGVMRLTTIPTKYEYEKQPTKLSQQVLKSLFSIPEVSGCGYIYGRLHIHIRATGNGRPEVILKDLVGQTLKEHGYSCRFIVQSVIYTDQ